MYPGTADRRDSFPVMTTVIGNAALPGKGSQSQGELMNFRTWIMALAVLTLFAGFAMANVSPPAASLTTQQLFPLITEQAGFDSGIVLNVMETPSPPAQLVAAVTLNASLTGDLVNSVDNRNLTANATSSATAAAITYTQAALNVVTAGGAAAAISWTGALTANNSAATAAPPPEVVYLGDILAGTRTGNATG